LTPGPDPGLLPPLRRRHRLLENRKIFKMAICKVHQHCPFQSPPSYTQIEILGMQIYHLATLTCRPLSIAEALAVFFAVRIQKEGSVCRQKALFKGLFTQSDRRTDLSFDNPIFCVACRTTPGVDVMITIFCDFRQFSAKKLAFFSKTNVMIKILHNLALF
jgi:hypothetical protein